MSPHPKKERPSAMPSECSWAGNPVSRAHRFGKDIVGQNGAKWRAIWECFFASTEPTGQRNVAATLQISAFYDAIRQSKQ